MFSIYSIQSYLYVLFYFGVVLKSPPPPKMEGAGNLVIFEVKFFKLRLGGGKTCLIAYLGHV